MDKETNAIMRYISSTYKESVKCVTNQSNQVKGKNYQLESDFISHIDAVLDFFPDEYAQIIRNDYLSDRDVKWWQEYFSKSTYYRKKSKAVHEFVRCVTA